MNSPGRQADQSPPSIPPWRHTTGQSRRRRAPGERRLRAARACDSCRRMKEKCEGGNPCERCVRTGRTCQFNSPGHPEPASTGANILAGDSVQSERTRYLEQIVTHFLGDIPTDVTNLKRIVDRLNSLSNSTTAGPEIDLDDLEGLTLDDENFTVKTLSNNTAHYSGEFSHWNFSQRIRRRVTECLDDPTGECVDSNKILEFWRAAQLQSPKCYVREAMANLPPRNVADFLVHIYFQFAQTNTFYVEQGWLRGKLEALYEPGASLLTEDAAWLCAVFMVFAIGSQFASMATGPHSCDPSTSDAWETSTEHDVGITLYQTASKLIPDVIAIASLESVQACLLLAHYALPLDTQGLAYTYLGLAIKMAIQNGMHRKYVGSDFDAWTIETRNRLWWTAYTVEKRVSVLHGRPPSITSTEVDADLPTDLPEFRKYDHLSKFGNMSCLIHMTVQLGELGNAISLLRKCPRTLQATYFKRIVGIRKQLNEWWNTLPEALWNPSPQSPNFRANAHLKLCFHLNQIFMGRPFIFSDSKIPSPSAEIPSPSGPGRTRRACLVSDALNAGFEVIELCQQLQEATGLASASYTEFSSCRAALLVLLAQSLNESTPKLRSTLKLGMTLIKSMTRGNISAKSEASVIEAIETAISRLNSQGNPQSGENEPQSPESEYVRFKRWASLWKPRNETEGGGSNQVTSDSVGGEFSSMQDHDLVWPVISPNSRQVNWNPEQMTDNDFRDMFSPFIGSGEGNSTFAGFDSDWQDSMQNLPL